MIYIEQNATNNIFVNVSQYKTGDFGANPRYLWRLQNAQGRNIVSFYPENATSTYPSMYANRYDVFSFDTFKNLPENLNYTGGSACNLHLENENQYWLGVYEMPSGSTSYNPSSAKLLNSLAFIFVPVENEFYTGNTANVEPNKIYYKNGTGITPTPSNTASPTPTPSITPTNTGTPTQTPTNTATPTLTPTNTPTNTTTPTLTPTNTPTNTTTPTLTPTNTPTPTCPVFTTQYLKTITDNSGGFGKIIVSLYSDIGLTTPTNAICDYVVSGTLMNVGNQYNWSRTITSGSQSSSGATGYGIITDVITTSVIPSCGCVIVIPEIPPTPTPTNTGTPTQTPTPTPSPT